MSRNPIYATINFTCKRDLELALLKGERIMIFSLDNTYVCVGVFDIQGPWFKSCPNWEATVVVLDGVIISIMN